MAKRTVVYPRRDCYSVIKGVLSQATKRHGGTNPRRLQFRDALRRSGTGRRIDAGGSGQGRDRKGRMWGFPESGEPRLSGAALRGTRRHTFVKPIELYRLCILVYVHHM